MSSLVGWLRRATVGDSPSREGTHDNSEVQMDPLHYDRDRRIATSHIPDTSPTSNYEVTSEGRVVVNVSELVKSDAVQRLAKLAEKIVDLSARNER